MMYEMGTSAAIMNTTAHGIIDHLYDMRVKKACFSSNCLYSKWWRSPAKWQIHWIIYQALRIPHLTPHTIEYFGVKLKITWTNRHFNVIECPGNCSIICHHWNIWCSHLNTHNSRWYGQRIKAKIVIDPAPK